MANVEFLFKECWNIFEKNVGEIISKYVGSNIFLTSVGATLLKNVGSTFRLENVITFLN